MAGSNKKGELSSAFLDKMISMEFQLAPIGYKADMLATLAIELGWQWHPSKIEEPLTEWEKELLDGGPWKDLPALEFPEYEINSDGHIRHRETKEIVQPEWDEQWNRYCVKLTKPNDIWLKIDGPQAAKEMFQ